MPVNPWHQQNPLSGECGRFLSYSTLWRLKLVQKGLSVSKLGKWEICATMLSDHHARWPPCSVITKWAVCGFWRGEWDDKHSARLAGKTGKTQGQRWTQVFSQDRNAKSHKKLLLSKNVERQEEMDRFLNTCYQSELKLNIQIMNYNTETIIKIFHLKKGLKNMSICCWIIRNI